MRSHSSATPESTQAVLLLKLSSFIDFISETMAEKNNEQSSCSSSEKASKGRRRGRYGPYRPRKQYLDTFSEDLTLSVNDGDNGKQFMNRPLMDHSEFVELHGHLQVPQVGNKTIQQC